LFRAAAKVRRGVEDAERHVQKVSVKLVQLFKELGALVRRLSRVNCIQVDIVSSWPEVVVVVNESRASGHRSLKCIFL
jgi:hypothetical protein